MKVHAGIPQRRSKTPRNERGSERVFVRLQNADALTLNTTRHKAEQGDKRKKVQLYFDYNQEVQSVILQESLTESIFRNRQNLKEPYVIFISLDFRKNRDRHRLCAELVAS